MFIITTTCLIIKHEEKDEEEIEGVTETYRQLYSVLRLDIVQRWIIMILTCKISFAAVDAVLTLKILDAGVPKEKLALLAVPLTPIQIVLPILFAPLTTGSEPLNLWLKAYIPRIVMGLLMTGFVYITPAWIQVNYRNLGQSAKFIIGRIARCWLFFNISSYIIDTSSLSLCHVCFRYGVSRTSIRSIDWGNLHDFVEHGVQLGWKLARNFGTMGRYVLAASFKYF